MATLIDRPTFDARIWLVARAVQAALRTSNVPQRLDYFFPVPGEMGSLFDKGAPQHIIRELKDKKWQGNFLLLLSTRGAVTVSGNFTSVKNRYFFENLIEGVKKRGPEYNTLLDLVWQASGGEAGGWRALVAEKNETTPSPPPEPEPEVDTDRPAEIVVDAPATMAEEIPTKAPRTTDPMEVLRHIEAVVMTLLNYEEKIADNIVYVRDDVIKLHSRNDKLNEKMRALHERIAALEEKLQLPTPPMPQEAAEPVVDQELRDQVQSVIVSVNSMSSAVNTMKQEVQQVVESSLHQSASDRVQQIQSSLARISSEFGALRELALETFSEVGR
jgi:hypothetical protein